MRSFDPQTYHEKRCFAVTVSVCAQLASTYFLIPRVKEGFLIIYRYLSKMTNELYLILLLVNLVKSQGKLNLL